jgi:MFS transporter, FSR family, fosmidomycin resistance protein
MINEADGNINKRKLAIVGSSHFFHDIYPAFLAPLMPLLILNFGLSYTETGILFFLVQIPSIFIPLIGLIADRYSFNYFIILSPALSGIIMSFIPLAPSYTVIAVMLFFAGAISALYHVPSPVMIRYFSGNKIGTGMSVYMFSGELARTAGPLIIVTAISWFGFEGSYKVFVIGILASIVLYWQLKDVDVKKNTNFKSDNGLLISWKKLRFLFLLVAGLLLSKAFMIKALTSFLPTYMTSKGTGIWVAGAALSILELAGAFGAISSGTLSDRIGRKRMLIISFAAAPFAMLFFMMAEGMAVIPLLLLLGFINFSITPVLLALIQENENEYPASANSIFMFFNFIISSFVVILFGVLSDLYHLDTIYYLSIIMTIAGIPFIFKLPEGTKA